MRHLRGTIALILGMAPGCVLAQGGPGPESSVMAGPSPYALSGTGTGLGVNLGIAFRPVGGLVIEPGLGFFTYRNDFKQRSHWFFPELSLQAEVRSGSLRPYVGAGGGAGVQSRVGSDRWVGTLHAVAGLRLRLGQSWGVRGELRARAVPPFSGHTLDVGIGLVRGMF